MAKNKSHALMELVKANRTITLAHKLASASSNVRTAFEDDWIALARHEAGVSRSDLNGRGSSDRPDEAKELVANWGDLEQILPKTGFKLEQTGEWYFTLNINGANKIFRFPYTSVAFSVCEYLVQHYTT